MFFSFFRTLQRPLFHNSYGVKNYSVPTYDLSPPNRLDFHLATRQYQKFCSEIACLPPFEVV
jgi:hypothetical protein